MAGLGSVDPLLCLVLLRTTVVCMCASAPTEISMSGVDVECSGRKDRSAALALTLLDRCCEQKIVSSVVAGSCHSVEPCKAEKLSLIGLKIKMYPRSCTACG